MIKTQCRWMDGWTDGQMDGWMDTPSYGDARTHLKIAIFHEERGNHSYTFFSHFLKIELESFR